MLKEICFIKTVTFLLVFQLSVSYSEDYKLLKDLPFDENDHTRPFNKDLNTYSQSNNYNDDEDSIEFDPTQRKYNELLGKLRIVLTFILNNPNYIHYLTNIKMPVHNIDVRPVEDFDSENVSLILRQIVNSGKKNDKKASDSSESSESVENDKKNLRYESCERGRKKCVKACKSSYREACYLETCGHSLRRKLRKMCKKTCKKWFI